MFNISLITTINKNKQNFYKINNKAPQEFHEKKLTCELTQISTINKSLINFKGGYKFNKKDLLFISTLAGALNITNNQLENLKDIFSRFIKQENIDNLDNLNINDDEEKLQSLGLEIIEKYNLNDKQIDILADYFYEKFNNLPKTEKKVLSEEEILAKEKEIDLDFLNALCKTYKFSKEDSENFKNIIYSYLTQHKIKNLKNIFAEDLSHLLTILIEEFNLNKEQENLFIREHSNRVFSDDYKANFNALNLNEDYYKTDFIIFEHLMKKYNIDIKNSKKLLDAIKDDCLNNNFNSIIDMFCDSKNYSNYKKTISVLNEKEFINIKNDLLMDLITISKNKYDIAKQIDEKDSKQYEKSLKKTEICNKISSYLNFSSQEYLELMRYLNNINNELNSWEIAYNVTEKYNLDLNSCKSIVKIIENISNK